MKKVFKKNQIVIAVLAVMIAAAGYLNYSGKIFGSKNKTAETGSEMANKELLDISDQDTGSDTGAGEIVVPVVMAAAMTTSMDAMASSKGWRIMSGFMVRRWFCPNAGCGFCSRQGAENSALRSLVGNGRYKGNYIFRCTLLSDDCSAESEGRLFVVRSRACKAALP